MSKKEELISRLREVRSMLLATILGLTEAELTNELVTEKWSIKDILGHVASWEEESIRVIEAFLNEEKPKYGYVISEENNWSEWNLGQWEKKRGLSYKQTLENLFATHEKFIKLIESLSEEQLILKKWCPWQSESTIEYIIRVEIDHDLEHANQILRWREKSPR